MAELLTSIGWHPGRDIGEAAETWYTECREDIDIDVELRAIWERGWERMPESLRFPPIQLHDTARRIVAEFGGLVIPGYRRGNFFRHRLLFFPGRVIDAPAGVEYQVYLAQILGTPLWQVARFGEPPDQNGLAVDPSGRTFVVGDVGQMYAGPTFDEALIRLINGEPLRQVPDDWMWWNRR